MKNKRYKALPYALYSLQFYRDKDGTLNLTETANTGSIDDIHSMYLFGVNIAESEFLEIEDKKALASFCKSFLKKFNKLQTISDK